MEKLEKSFLAGQYTPFGAEKMLTKSPNIPESSVVSQSVVPPSTPQTHHPTNQGICTKLKKMLTQAGVYQCTGVLVCRLRF